MLGMMHVARNRWALLCLYLFIALLAVSGSSAVNSNSRSDSNSDSSSDSKRLENFELTEQEEIQIAEDRLFTRHQIQKFIDFIGKG